MTIDITSPRTFTVAAILCIIAGGAIGILCSFLFYTVSHIQVIVNGARTGEYAATQINPLWGIVFILIMAGTALCIALTFRFVPGWVAQYYQTREVPPFAKWIRGILIGIEEFFGEDKE